MVDRVFCDACGKEIVDSEPTPEGVNTRLVAKVRINYYPGLSAMKEDNVWSHYEFDLCTEDLAKLEEAYDIVPVTGEKKGASAP